MIAMKRTAAALKNPTGVKVIAAFPTVITEEPETTIVVPLIIADAPSELTRLANPFMNPLPVLHTSI